jgi:adenylate cyclase
MQDRATTPFDAEPVPRVGIHGNLVKTIVAQQFLQRLPPWTDLVLVFALTLAAAALAVAGGARSVLCKIATVAVLALYVAATFELFRRYQLVLPFTAPLGAAFTTSFAGLIWQIVEEQEQKGRIKGLFGTYLSPTVVNNLIASGKDPELGGHDAEITAYFSDIQEFSSFSEVLPAAKLGELLNEYLSACTDIVQAEGGTLDKFIGDAVVAMYGAPVECTDHAYRACVASQLVQRRIVALREKWRSEGDKWPQRVHHLQTRIGLNTGVCMIGNMGSRTRFNYTMMGDNVNLAARMESGAKSWGAYSMVAEATKLACEQHGGDRVVFRPLGRIVVKGRSQAVPIFEIVGLKEFVTAEARECVGLFAQGLASYYARDWDAAIARFQQSVRLEPNQPGQTPGVKSNPSLVYLDITAHYRAEPPPANWDGVYVMKEK